MDKAEKKDLYFQVPGTILGPPLADKVTCHRMYWNIFEIWTLTRIFYYFAFLRIVGLTCLDFISSVGSTVPGSIMNWTTFKRIWGSISWKFLHSFEKIGRRTACLVGSAVSLMAWILLSTVQSGHLGCQTQNRHFWRKKTEWIPNSTVQSGHY